MALQAVPRRQLSPLFDVCLEELARSGVSPTPHESVWLSDLVSRVAGDYPACMAQRVLGLPITVGFGTLKLYPLTVGAEIWLEEFGVPWFRNDGVIMDVLVTAYASAHAGQPQAFADLTEYWQARRVIRRWGRLLLCSISELKQALNRLLPVATIPLENENKAESSVGGFADEVFGTYLATISANTGIPIRDLLWKHSEEDLQRLRRAVQHKLSGGQVEEFFKSETPQEDLRLVVREIIRRHKSQEIPRA